MSLSLLVPGVLGLSLLLAGPVIAHLIRKNPEERVAFGAMLLLERLRRRVERRRRVHDRALLALRLLLAAILVLALARPELHLPTDDAGLGASGRVVVVVDTSLSMDARGGGESAFIQAQREAAATIRALPDAAKVAVITAGVPVEGATGGWTADHAVAVAEVEALTQGFGATDLDGALTAARTLLAGAPGEVLVFSDRAGPGNLASAAESLERLVATGSSITPRPVGPAAAENVVVTDAHYGDGLEGGTVQLALANFGTADREVPATVRLPDGAEMSVFVQVPGATAEGPGAASAAVTVPRQAAGGVASVALTDASLPLDDTRYFHLPRVGQSRVLIVDGDPGSSPTKSEVYFLERALAPVAGTGAALDVVSPAGASRLSEGKWRVAIVANVGDPGPLAPVLIDFVRGGGALVLAVGDNVSPGVWNSALGPILPAPLTRVRDLVSPDAEVGLPLRAPDAAIDLFDPFATSGRLGFERVRSRRLLALEGFSESDEVHSLLSYQGGAPALVERVVGNGRVILWTSTLDLGWTSFPLQTVFAPFCARLVGWLGGEVGSAASRLEGTVGEAVSVALRAGEELQVTGPDGARVGVTRLPGAMQFVPELPGAYAVGRAGEAASTWVAVNCAARESDIRPDEDLAEVTARLDPGATGRTVPLDGALLVVCAALWAFSSLLAARPAAEAVAP